MAEPHPRVGDDAGAADRIEPAAHDRADGRGGGATWSGTAVVARGTAVLQDRSAGRTAGPGSRPCDAGSRFQACSISKLVESVVALSLVDAGEVDLQTPVSAWLDDLPTAWASITLHHLLSNTSGLGHWGDIPGLPRLLTTPPPLEDLLELVAAAPLTAAPGSAWRYSGPGFLVVALVIEAVTRRAYPEVARDLVFGPAAMDATSSGTPARDETNLADGHEQGRSRARPLHPDFGRLVGSGDLWTTRGDLLRLGRALRGGQLLPGRSAARLWTPRATLPAAAADAGPVEVRAYGYGTFLGTVHGLPARINPGDGPGYQTLLAYVPDDDLDVVVLCNQDAPSVSAALAELGPPA